MQIDGQGKNLLKTEKINLEYDEKNEYTHLYTLVLKVCVGAAH